MATAAVFEDRSMSIGRVFARAFATLGGNPTVMFGLAFLFRALPGAVLGYGLSAVRLGTFASRDFTYIWVWTLGGWLVGLILSTITQGALVRATVARSEGRRASFGESAQAGLRVVLPLVGLGILLGVGVGIGLMFVVVPGVILYVMWSVAAPALVEERRGVFAAFARSQELTKGARWRVFALELVVLVFYWLFSAALGLAVILGFGVGGAAVAGMSVWYLAGTALVQTVVAAVWGAIQTSLYVELRLWKDGPAGDALADIFA